MSDYLAEIESAYSRCRGKRSLLSPIDWQLAQSWQDAGIPLHIALSAIEDCCRNFRERKNPGLINTLRYFEQEVRKQYGAWQQSRVGASVSGPEALTTSESSPNLEEPNPSDAAIARLDLIIKKFGEAKTTASSDLHDALSEVINAVFLVVLQIEGNGDTSETEDQLRAIAEPFNRALVESAGPDDLAAVTTHISRDFGTHKFSDEVIKKLLVKRLYERYDLPQLTLYNL